MSVASKLNIKPNHAVCALHIPDDVDLELPPEAQTVEDPASADAVVVFATNNSELQSRGEPLVDAARRDAVAWMAYPKAKQLGTDLNRDIVWQALEGRGIKPVRQIAVNDVWSALRFRPA
jgi:hypothetical protein